MGTSMSRALTRFREFEDPTLGADLYSWSNEEFCNEYALIYTSRSNPSHTCISHFRSSNHNKVLFTLHDRLCEGNTVRVDMEFTSERGLLRLIVFRNTDADKTSGSFRERSIVDPYRFLLVYEDKFGHRKGLLRGCLVQERGGEFVVEFITGFEGGSFLRYYIRILGHPSKGLDVDLSGPYCESEYNGIRDRIGLCCLNHVSGMPPQDVLKQKKQRNKKIVGTPLVPAAQNNNNAILNAGKTQGNFNGSVFTDCTITVEAQTMWGFNALFRKT